MKVDDTNIVSVILLTLHDALVNRCQKGAALSETTNQDTMRLWKFIRPTELLFPHLILFFLALDQQALEKTNEHSNVSYKSQKSGRKACKIAITNGHLAEWL